MIDGLLWLWNRLGVWFLPRNTRPYEREEIELKLERERTRESTAQWIPDDREVRERQLRQDFPNAGGEDQPVHPFLKAPEGANEREARSSSRKKTE